MRYNVETHVLVEKATWGFEGSLKKNLSTGLGLCFSGRAWKEGKEDL